MTSPKKPNFLVVCLVLFQLICHNSLLAEDWQPNWTQSLDRPYTLRLSEPLVLEREIARQMQTGHPMSFIFPRPCFSEIDSSRVCGNPPGFTWQDKEAKRSLGVSPILGYEYRYYHENVHAFEGGLFTAGGSGPVSFDLDARMFTELHENFDAPSYDREFTEKQDADASGSIAYTSYSRYRAHLSWDVGWGRFMAGRDAPHWGPGVYGNMVFNRKAVPFNILTFTTTLGPLTVQSLYGQLQNTENGEFEKISSHKSIIGHRYEIDLFNFIEIGINEQLILFKNNEAWGVIPIVPLYISKGNGAEPENNGLISFDFNLHINSQIRIYTELLIDDLQSPTSLFDNFWANKWGTLFGINYFTFFNKYLFGIIFEYTRVEPWVYTHYSLFTAQASNSGYPIGNPDGPNSQTFYLNTFLSHNKSTISIPIKLTFNGSDKGSKINDVHNSQIDGTEKHFLNKYKHKWSITPEINCKINRLDFSGSANFPNTIIFRVGFSK